MTKIKSLKDYKERELPKIKFSHEYLKFCGKKLPLTVDLLQCFKVHYNDLSEGFLVYDTTHTNGYISSELYESSRRYKLPKTDLIILLLRIPDEFCITTIRRFTKEKWDYYKSLEGKEVALVKV